MPPSDLWNLLPLALALLPPSLGPSADLATLAVTHLVSQLPPACPDDMVLVDGEFCGDFPYVCSHALPGRCAEFSPSPACKVASARRRYCVDRHEWPNQVGENPRVYVTWWDAKQLCASVDKRLCRRSEWMLACEGPKRLPYPWGYVRQPSPCNIDHPHVPFDLTAMLHPPSRDEELDRLWQADPIGLHPNCISAWGAYDMSGNVDEWTDNDLERSTTPFASTLNGGYWGTVRNTCRLTTTSHGPEFAFYQVGFRCCMETLDRLDPVE